MEDGNDVFQGLFPLSEQKDGDGVRPPSNGIKASR